MYGPLGGTYAFRGKNIFQTSALSLSLSFASPLSFSLSLPTFCDKSCFCSAKQKGKLTQGDFGNTAFVVKSPPQGIVKNVPALVLQSTEASKEIMESSCLKVFRGYESC